MASKTLILFITCWSLTAFGMLFSQVRTNGNQAMNDQFWMRSSQNGIFIISAKGYFGLADSLGNVLCEPKYDQIGEFKNHVAIIELDGKVGLLDDKGSEVISLGSYDLVRPADGVYIVSLAGKKGMLGEDYKENIPIIYEEIEHLTSNKYKVKLNRFYGVVNQKNEVLISVKYDQLSVFASKQILAKYSNESFVLIGDDNKEIPLNFENVADIIHGVSKVKLIGKYGLIDSLGKNLIPCLYDDIIIKEKGIAWLFNGKWGVSDSYTEKNESSYDEMVEVQDDYIIVKKNGKVGAVDFANKIIIPFKYEQISALSAGILVAKTNSGYVAFNATGELLHKDSYNLIVKLSDRYIKGFHLKGRRSEIQPTSMGGKMYGTWVVIDCKEKKVVGKYEDVKILKNDLLIVQKLNSRRSVVGTWGIINGNTGKVIVPFLYNYISDLDDQNIIVGISIKPSQELKYGMIDYSGKLLVPIIYDELVNDPNYHLLMNRTGNLFGVLKLDNTTLLEATFDWVAPYYHQGLLKVKVNGQFGFIDLLGKWVIPAQYTWTDDYFKNGKIKVVSDGITKIINKKNEEVD